MFPGGLGFRDSVESRKCMFEAASGFTLDLEA